MRTRNRERLCVCLYVFVVAVCWFGICWVSPYGIENWGGGGSGGVCLLGWRVGRCGILCVYLYADIMVLGGRAHVERRSRKTRRTASHASHGGERDVVCRSQKRAGKAAGFGIVLLCVLACALIMYYTCTCTMRKLAAHTRATHANIIRYSILDVIQTSILCAEEHTHAKHSAAACVMHILGARESH